MHRMINKRKDESGFTLIELLVVVVIIGVLVAIAVPVYLNYRQGAADKSAQSDVRGAISAMEQYYTENGNAYPTSPTGVQSATFNLGASTLKVTMSDKSKLNFIAAGSTYTVCAKNDDGNKFYRYRSSQGGSIEQLSALTLATCA